ncbi:MAG: roadblock/LC7 domain-containing protein [bacterium]
MARTTADLDTAAGEERPGDALHDRLRDLLARFEREVKGVLGSAVIDSEGVALAWTLKGGAHQIVVSTLGTALHQLIGRTGGALDLGPTERGIVTCEKGSLAVYDVPRTNGLLLVVLLDSNANYIDFMVRVRLLVTDVSRVVAGGA